jgi:hypothetical protein
MSAMHQQLDVMKCIICMRDTDETASRLTDKGLATVIKCCKERGLMDMANSLTTGLKKVLSV